MCMHAGLLTVQSHSRARLQGLSSAPCTMLPPNRSHSRRQNIPWVQSQSVRQTVGLCFCYLGADRRVVLVGAMRLTALSGALAGFARDLHGTSGVAKPPLLACWSWTATSASRCKTGYVSFSVSFRLAIVLMYRQS